MPNAASLPALVNQVDALRRGHNAQLRIGAGLVSHVDDLAGKADAIMRLVSGLDRREALATKAALINALADGRTCGADDDRVHTQVDVDGEGPYAVYVAIYWRRYRPRSALGRPPGRVDQRQQRSPGQTSWGQGHRRRHDDHKPPCMQSALSRDQDESPTGVAPRSTEQVRYA